MFTLRRNVVSLKTPYVNKIISAGSRFFMSTQTVDKEDDDKAFKNGPPEPPSNDKRDLPVNYEDVSRAYYRIRSGIVRTPCVHSAQLSELCGTEVWIKKDFRQKSGSFKERGARNSLLQLNEEQRKIGVVAASA